MLKRESNIKANTRLKKAEVLELTEEFLFWIKMAYFLINDKYYSFVTDIAAVAGGQTNKRENKRYYKWLEVFKRRS